MAKDTYRVFWFFIKGDSRAFEMTVPDNISISRLKDMVWEKRKNGVLRGVDAADLMVLKVSTERLADSSQLTSYL
jgi:hypothetical protein